MPMSILRRIGFVLAALLIIACTGPGNTGPGNRGPGDNRPPNRPNVPTQAIKGCDVRKVPPTALPWAGGVPGMPTVPIENQLIVATAIATCDVVPPAHVMYVGMEELAADGSWQKVPDPFGNYESKCETPPGPGAPVTCEFKVTCIDGRYRTTVTVQFVDQFGAGEFTPPEEAAATIICPL